MNAIAKEIPQNGNIEIAALQVAFARYSVAAVVLLPFVIFQPERRKTVHWRRYLVRTIAGFGGIVLMFVAVRFVPLATATAIGFTNPIFAMFFAVLSLQERLTRRRMLAAGLGLSGAMVIALPQGANPSLASLIPLTAAVFMGAEVVSIKYLSQTKDHVVTIIFFSNLIGALFALVGALPVWVWPSPMQTGLLASLGIVAVLGQFFVLRGARLADASFLAPFFYASLVYSTALGYLFFDEIPTRSAIMGCGVILISAIVLSQRSEN
jgi:drug/metabolite transporter (DMT)-like permease